MKKRLKQSGFTIVEGLLILVILGIVGGTGYFVWHAKQATDKTLSETGNSQNTKQAAKITNFAECKASTGSIIQETFPEVCVTKSGEHFTDTSDQTAQWTAYTAPDNSYSMKIPDGWNFDQNSQTRGDLQIMDNSLAIKPGTKGTYYVTPGYGKDYDYGFTINYYDSSQSDQTYNEAIKGAAKQSSLKTKSGLEVEKYYYLQTTDPGTPGLQKGGKSYTYAMKDNGKLVLIFYSFGPDQTDYHQNVELALKTISIL